MKHYRKNLFAILTVVFVILLAACQDSSEESSADLDNPSQNEQTSQNNDEDTANTDSTKTATNTETNSNDTSNIDTNEKEDTSNTVPEKEEKPASNAAASFKEEYLKKLNATKKETDEMEATDTSTFALKKVENDRWEAWDELLNEVYGVLKGQLSAEEMEQLRNEQRNWLKYRDDSALEASLKYKGGTQEHLEYVAVLANLTEVRCYELVEDYM